MRERGRRRRDYPGRTMEPEIGALLVSLLFPGVETRLPGSLGASVRISRVRVNCVRIVFELVVSVPAQIGEISRPRNQENE